MPTQSRKLSLSDGGTLEDFISRIAQGIYIVTPDGRIVDANPAMLEVFGAESLEELQKYRSEDLVVDPNVLHERRRLLAEHGWLRNYKYQIRCLDGSVRSVRDTVFMQRDDGGQVVALHGMLSLDDDNAAPEAWNDPRLSSFFTGAPAGLAILDGALRFVRINRRLADMHILSVEDHIGRPLAEALPGLAPIVEPILRQVLATGKPAVNFEITTEEPASPGSVRVWRFSAFPVGPAGEEPAGLGVVVVDITDAKLVEREARLDRRYFEALIESSPLAMVSLDGENRIVSTNTAFEQMFLFARDELVGVDLDDMIAPPNDHAPARQLTQRTQSGERLRVDVVRQRRDGARIRVRVHAAAIVLDGQHVGAYAIYEELGGEGSTD